MNPDQSDPFDDAIPKIRFAMSPNYWLPFRNAGAGEETSRLHRTSAFSRWTTRQVVLTALILAISSALRFHALGNQPLWLDEGYSWWDSEQSLSNLWSLVPQCDPHPPLYFVLLKGWIYLVGDSSAGLRSLSAIFSVVTTAIIVFAGWEVDEWAGYLAGLLFALKPFQIEFSHEARPYTLLCLGAAILLWGGMRIVSLSSNVAPRVEGTAVVDADGEEPHRSGHFQGVRRTAWITLVSGGLIVLWSNNTSVLMVSSLLGALLLMSLIDPSLRKMTWPIVLLAIVIASLWLPYVPEMLDQARGVISAFWIPRPEGWHIPNELRMVVSLSEYDAVWWAVLAIVAGLVLLWRRGLRRESVILAALGFAPVVLNYLVSINFRSIFIARALIGIVPAVTIIIASSVRLVSFRWMRYGAVTLLLMAHGFALYTWQVNFQGKEPWDKIARELTERSSGAGTGHADEVVLVAANELALPLDHALKDLNVSLPVAGAPANFPAPGMTAQYPSGKCAPSLAGQDLSIIRKAVHGHSLIYFITRTNNEYDPGNRVIPYLIAMGLRAAGTQTYMPGNLEVHKFLLGGMTPGK